MTYDDVQAILGSESVEYVESAVNNAIVASRMSLDAGGMEALELLLTTQLAAVIITRLGKREPALAVERVADWLKTLVSEAIKIRDVAVDNPELALSGLSAREIN